MLFLDNYIAGYILKKIPLATGPTIINWSGKAQMKFKPKVLTNCNGNSDGVVICIIDTINDIQKHIPHTIMNAIEGNNRDKLLTLSKKGKEYCKEMLILKQQVEEEIINNIGYENVEFLKNLLRKSWID